MCIISVAPMMGYTDRHFRYLVRLIAPRVRLYTEMITTHTLIHASHSSRFLQFDPTEKYVALQLGGSDPKQLALCAKMGESLGYDEINLNVGCPSSRVKSGHFGACLMLKPELVAESVYAMRVAVNIPVTIKCRIGVDDHDSYEHLCKFIEMNVHAGCQSFMIHARKAWLSGLSPKQNRSIPPLQYEIVSQLKADFRDLTIVLNGGIKTIKDINTHLKTIDGVMIGREAYSNPFVLAAMEQASLAAETNLLTRAEVINKFLPYVSAQLHNGVRLTSLTRHMLGLFQGEPGARAWRQYLSQNASLPGVGIEVIEQALALVNEEQRKCLNTN